MAELPSIAVVLTEHRLHRLRCSDCGALTRAELPPELPAGAFGPRLRAAVATLAVRNRISRRDTVELVGELFGARLCTGSIDAILQRTAAALAEPYQDLLAQTRASPAVNVDETGWRTRGSKRTLWGALTPGPAVFRIAPDRHEREAKVLLGEHFAGIACTDRWWAYNYLEANGDSSAGLTWHATLPPMPKASGPRRSSGGRPANRQAPLRRLDLYRTTAIGRLADASLPSR